MIEIMDKSSKLIKALLKSIANSFDVYEDYAYCGERFEGYAEFHELGSKYVLSKKAKLWSVEADEYMFLKAIDELDVDALQRLVDFMKTCGFEKVNPRPDHMSTAITLVCVCNSVSPEASNIAKHIKHRKNYRFSIWGWADLRLVVVDLSKNEVTTNAFAKHLLPVVKQNFTIL